MAVATLPLTPQPTIAIAGVRMDLLRVLRDRLPTFSLTWDEGLELHITSIHKVFVNPSAPYPFDPISGTTWSFLCSALEFSILDLAPSGTPSTPKEGTPA